MTVALFPFFQHSPSIAMTFRMLSTFAALCAVVLVHMGGCVNAQKSVESCLSDDATASAYPYFTDSTLCGNVGFACGPWVNYPLIKGPAPMYDTGANSFFKTCYYFNPPNPVHIWLRCDFPERDIDDPSWWVYAEFHIYYPDLYAKVNKIAQYQVEIENLWSSSQTHYDWYPAVGTQRGACLEKPAAPSTYECTCNTEWWPNTYTFTDGHIPYCTETCRDFLSVQRPTCGGHGYCVSTSRRCTCSAGSAATVYFQPAYTTPVSMTQQYYGGTCEWPLYIAPIALNTFQVALVYTGSTSGSILAISNTQATYSLYAYQGGSTHVRNESISGTRITLTINSASSAIMSGIALNVAVNGFAGGVAQLVTKIKAGGLVAGCKLPFQSYPSGFVYNGVSQTGASLCDPPPSNQVVTVPFETAAIYCTRVYDTALVGSGNLYCWSGVASPAGLSLSCHFGTNMATATVFLTYLQTSPANALVGSLR